MSNLLLTYFSLVGNLLFIYKFYVFQEVKQKIVLFKKNIKKHKKNKKKHCFISPTKKKHVFFTTLKVTNRNLIWGYLANGTR